MKLRGLFAIVLTVLLLLGLLTVVAAADELKTAVEAEGAPLAFAPAGAGIDVVATQYTFSSSSGTYTPIVTGTVHGTASNDDTSFAAINIGFTFRYNNVDYTQASIQSNGWIAMGPTIASSYYPLSTSTYNNVIAALARDLQGNGTTSELRSLTDGTAPNRVFIVQWTDYKRYGSAYVGDYFDFQIRLYETSNRVEVVYGDFTVLYVASPPYGPQVGLRGNSNADFNNRTMDATQSWATSVAGTTNADSMTLTDVIYPASGQTYDWSLATGLFLDPAAQSGGACPGSDVLYEFDVINQTGVAQAFNLAYSSVWPASGPAATGVLPNLGTETISPTVHIPWAANAGDTDVMTVNAADATNTYTNSATATTVAALASGYTDYANVPVGREVRAPGVVYYDGRIFKIGGYGYIGTTGAARTWVDIYDIATDTWTAGADLPAARYWIDCEEIGGYIYCAGGYLSAGTNTLYIYDIATNTWTTGATLPANRYNYASAKLNGKYYVIGGYTTTYEASMLAYDPATNTWDTTRAPMSTARRYFHAGVIGGQIYVAGGYNPSYLSSAEVYDPVANAWSPIASMPTAWLNAADGVKHDRFLILTGGHPSSTAGASNGALVYDALTDTWNWLPLLDRLLYGAEGDGDGTMFWTVSGRQYVGTTYSNSPYTTLLDQCEECVPVSGADFSVDPTVPRPNLPATFTGSVAGGSPAITYAWSFGDGAYGSGQVVDHTYTATGDYTVVMTATNCDGASSSVATHFVTVEAGPLIVVDPLSLESTQCPDSLMTYTLTICNDGDQPLTWSLTEVPPVLILGQQPGRAAQVPASGGNPDRLGPTPANRTQIPLFVQPDADVIVDGSFEAGTPNPYWDEYSLNYGSPLCTVAACGTGTGTGPRTGSWWSWFGGISANETGWMSQTVTIPAGTAVLSFWLEVPYCTDPNAYMSVRIDGTTLFTVYGNDPLCNLVGYVQQTIDVSAFADGAAHTVEFYSQLFGLNNNFMVDDVVLDVSSDSIPWVSEDPTSGTVAAGDCVTVEVTFDSTGMAAGTYTGTLQINSNDTLNPVVDVDLTMIVAGPPTGVDFTYTPPEPWMNQVVTFNGTATALMPVEYAWDFGDGAYGAGQNPTHAYAAAGTYTVIMTATQCGYAVVATDTVTVVPCWSLLTENFEGNFPPANWSVINNGGSCVWLRNDQVTSGRPNYAGGQGFCADADSDRCGSGTTMNTELRTMVLDLTGLTTATLEYVTSYNWFASGEYANTDISLDGGTTWTNLLNWTSDHSPSGPGEAVSLDLTQFQGESSIMIRFHYYAPGWDYWWQVDQVKVFGCYIPDAAPDIAVDPLSLTQELEVNQTAAQTFNIANDGLAPLTWTLEEGCGTPVGWLSETPTGGTLPVYQDTDVTVTFDSTGLALGTYNTTLCVNSNDPDEPQIQVAVTLIVTGTPEISVTPSSLETTLCQDETDTQYLEICNEGTGPLVWSLSEEPSGKAAIPAAPGGALPVGAVSIPQGRTGPAIADSGLPSGAPALAAPAGLSLPDDIGDAWEIMAPLPAGRVFNAVIASGSYVYVIGGTSDAGGATPTNTNYRYNTADNTWATMAPMPAALAQIDGIAIGGMIYIPGSDPDSNTYVYNTATDSWSVIPANGGYAAPVQYQVVSIGTNMYVLGGIIGGASTANVWRLDTTTGTWSAGVPMLNTRTSFSAEAIDGNIYVAGGVAYPGFTPNMTAEMFNGTAWSYIAPVPNGGGAYTRWSYNADGMAPGAMWLAAGRRDASWLVLNHAGYYDVATNTWTDSPTIPVLNQGRVYMEGAVASDGYFYVIGGRDSAGAVIYATNERLMVYNPVVDVPWVTEVPTNGVLMPGECVSVAVTFESDSLEDGVYTAGLVIASTDADEPEIIVPLTMTVGCPEIVVEPPALEVSLCPDTTATLTFTVCNEGSLPLDWELVEAPASVVLGTAGGAAPRAPAPGATGSRGGSAGAARPIQYNSVTSFSEGFDDITVLPGQGWFFQNNSSPLGLTDWFQGNDTVFPAHAGAPTAYIGANFNNTSGVGTISNWMLTPEISLSNGDTISFWTRVPDGSTWPDRLELRLSTAGASTNVGTAALDVGDFSTLLLSVNPSLVVGGYPEVWTQFSATLSGIPSGATGRVAFRYFVTDGGPSGSNSNYIGIDTVEYVSSSVYDIPWLSEDPISGTVPPGECTVVEVTFDSTGLAPGVYNGSLVITSNDRDTPEVTIPVTMTVLQPAEITNVTYTIDGVEVAFDSTAIGATPLTYAWNFGDGTPPSAVPDPTHVYAATGCYTPTLTVTNGCGSDTWSERICVCEAVAGVDFYWVPTVPLVGEMIDFTGSITAGSPPLVWRWNFDDGATATGKSVLHAFATFGEHVVTLTVTNGCGEETIQHTVMVNPYYFYLPLITKNHAP